MIWWWWWGGFVVVFFFGHFPLRSHQPNSVHQILLIFIYYFCSFHDAAGPVSFSGNCSTAGVFTARTPTCGQTPECSSSIKFLHLSLSFPFFPPNKPHPGRLCKNHSYITLNHPFCKSKNKKQAHAWLQENNKKYP